MDKKISRGEWLIAASIILGSIIISCVIYKTAVYMISELATIAFSLL